MDERLQRGVDAFNAGQFFTAHEIWEELWLETVGPEKLLLQGLVQIAAGYAKVESGLRGGALKLLTRGSQSVRAFGPVAAGLVLADFVAGVTGDVERLRSAAEPVSLDIVRVPCLRET